MIIGIESSFSCSWQLPEELCRELPGSFPEASRRIRNTKIDNWNRIITFVLLAASRSFLFLPGKRPGASRSDLYSGELVVSTANLVVVAAEACRGYRSGAVAVTPEDLVAVTTGSLFLDFGPETV